MVQVNLKTHDFWQFQSLTWNLSLFTRYLHGFEVLPLTWNIKRTSMLKARFEMVHVNQSKICILWWFGHLTWNIHERRGITNYLQPVIWTFNMVHVKQRKMQYFESFGDLDHLTWNLPGMTNSLQMSATWFSF